MKVKLDENLGRSIQRRLQSAGHDVERVTEEGLSGCTDAAVWDRANEEGRLVLTLDKGFSDLRVLTPGTHAGVLVLRPKRPGPLAVLRFLERMLVDGTFERLAGTLATADDSRTRIRTVRR